MRRNQTQILSLLAALACVGSIKSPLRDTLQYEHKTPRNTALEAETQQAAIQKRLRKQERNRKHANISKS